MKKFGLGKKGSDADSVDSARSALFGSRSKKSSAPAPAASNPYAAPQDTADPYMQDTNKYANMDIRPSANSSRSDVGNRYGGTPSGGSAPRPGYGREGSQDSRGPPGGYGERYGGSSGGYGAAGYGSDKYDQGSSASSSRQDAGGYGGLGRSDSYGTTTTEDNRDALFSGAQDRYQQRAQRGGPPGGAGGADGQSGDSGADHYGGYGQERQLTAEEEEEEDVQATKQQIRFMKQEDVSSTRNALRLAAQAEETGRGTLERLGAQGERIHNTERNLDMAASHNRVAEERARELKTLNKSMFAVHVSNPFTKTSRQRERDEDVVNKHRKEREERDATRSAAYGSKQRTEGAFKDLQPGDPGYGARPKPNLAERAKYQFEADSEDEDMENEIDSNLDALSGAAARLNVIARATGKEVDEQNAHIDRINAKSDRVDDQIAMNRARLDRIH